MLQGESVLRPGVQAPEFSIQLHTGNLFRLSGIKGDSRLVLFFYPKDFTYGCTKEVCTFRDHVGDLRALGATVIGVSRDPLELHARFAKRHALPFPLGTDPDLSLARLYDVVGWGGLWVKRVTYVIDKRGVIRGTLHHEILADTHWQESLEVLKTLNGPGA